MTERAPIFDPPKGPIRQSHAPILLATALATLSGCQVIDGSGTQASEVREIATASELSVCCGFEVDLTLTSDAGPKVRITTDDNLLEEVYTEVHGDQLEIGWNNAHHIHHPTDSVHVEVTLPSLRHFEGSGGTTLASGDVSGGKLRLDLSGGSRASLGEVDVSELDLNESGGSHVDIALLLVEMASLASSGGSRLETQGMAERLSANVSGGGALTAPDLITQDATLHLSGGSQARIAVTRRLDGAASGASEVWVGGDPEIDLELSGSSQIHRD